MLLSHGEYTVRIKLSWCLCVHSLPGGDRLYGIPRIVIVGLIPPWAAELN